MSRKKEITLEGFLSLVKTDSEGAISKIYDFYRSSFLSFGKKYTKNENLIIDAFQEAVLSLYNNAMKDKISVKNSTLKTYLFAIGKYKLINILQRENKYTEFQEYEELEHIDLDDEKVDIPVEVEQAYTQLGSTCQKMIELFYYRRYSIEAIMHTLNLKNKNSVKANKSRCIKKLRSLIEQIKETK